MQLIFWCFIRVPQRWALQDVIKRQILDLYLLFISISVHCWDSATSTFRDKWTPCGNCTSGFDFELFIVIAMRFCTDVPNVIRIGRSETELWVPVDFSRWRLYGDKSTSAFWFYDVSRLRRQRAIGVPIFDKISQSTAEILLLSLPKSNGRHTEILFPVSILTFHCHRHVILHWCTKFYANWMIIDGVVTSY